MNLVIAEKTSVARSIAAVIGVTEKQNGYWQGGGYLVSWCIGHLVSFAEADQYDEKYCKWRHEDLSILPQSWQFIVPGEKKQQFEIVCALLNHPDVDSVTAATDAGREGELIFRLVYQMAGCAKPVKRLWISSMEDAAIREGFANLRPDSDYDALYQSVLCRAKADWLIGINATRLFSVLYHKTLTVGRVQTPTLKMLVDRDAKILRFQKEKYYTVSIQSGGMRADSKRLSDAEASNSLKEKCTGANAVCTSVKREKKMEQPPKLYDLTTLHRKGKQFVHTKDGINLAVVLPESLTSPALTVEWENRLAEISKGSAEPDEFMAEIEAQMRQLAKTYSCISADKQNLFQSERVIIVKCPRCGENVYECKKNFYCGNRGCQFVMWKNDSFFEQRKKAFTSKIAAALLKNGKAKVKCLYFEKTDKTYDATVLLSDTEGKYVNYRIAADSIM